MEQNRIQGLHTYQGVPQWRIKKLIAVHSFFMSNLEGILIFFFFPVVGRRLFRNTVKILVEIVKFPAKVSGFFFGGFIGFL